MAAEAEPPRPSCTCGAAAPWPDVLTAHEVAAYLRLHYTVVLRLTKAGVLPALRAGRTWRYRRVALDAALAGRQQPEAEE